MTAPADAEVTFFSAQGSDEQPSYEELRVPMLRGRGEIGIACGYRRSRDLDAQGGPGQDCVALRGGAGLVVGVLADGVGQSFFGDLAAKEVAGFLTDFLWDRRHRPPAEAEVASALEELTASVQEKVLSQPLSTPPDSLLGKALERTRQHGTQTVFSAFIYSGETGELDLYQVGDTLTWVHTLDGVPESMPVNRGRWSSTGTGHLCLEHFRRSEVTGIVVHSDGLRREWAERLARPEVPKDVFLEEVREREEVDDISFVSLVRRRAEPAAGTDPVPVPIPVPADPEPAAVDPPHGRRPPRHEVVAAFVLGFLLGAGVFFLLGAIAGRKALAAGDCPPGCTAVKASAVTR